MPRTTPIRRGNQASDELGRGVLAVLWVLIAAALIVPATVVIHLAVGNAAQAGEWALTSVVCVVVALVLLAGVRSSSRDTRQLRASGVPGTATVLSLQTQEDGDSAVLRICVDGHEPFEASTRPGGGSRLNVGQDVQVVVDPADLLFAVVDPR